MLSYPLRIFIARMKSSPVPVRFRSLRAFMHGISMRCHWPSPQRSSITGEDTICSMSASRLARERRPARGHFASECVTILQAMQKVRLLRKTLGCLLGDTLNIKLRCVGGGKRQTFTNPGERELDKWMRQHARVTWAVMESPWLAEERLLTRVPLPLNLQGNAHPFRCTLESIRKAAKEAAMAFGGDSDNGGPRRLPRFSPSARLWSDPMKMTATIELEFESVGQRPITQWIKR